MPIVTGRSNNAILPANSRSVDVARKTLHDIAGIQQQRYHNAVAVAGYPVVVYNVLESGRRCSCSNRGATLATKLDTDGKLSPGQINELITGGLEFRVRRYGETQTNSEDYERGLHENVDSKGQTVVVQRDYVANSDDDAAATYIDEFDDVEGANGPSLGAARLAELVDQGDTDFGHTDVSCPVCMGTGFVGAASVLNGYRYVATPADPVFSTGYIDTLAKPLAMADSTVVTLTLALPKGATCVDAFTLWNGRSKVAATLLIDSVPISSDRDILQACDGDVHNISFLTPATTWTHVELQLGLNVDQDMVEFPRLGQSPDLKKLDPTDDVQLIASPKVAIIRRNDIIVDQVFGKAFRVHTVQLWNDKQRSLLGWDVGARVVQPNELLNLLPRRHRLAPSAPKFVRDNHNSGHRT